MQIRREKRNVSTLPSCTREKSECVSVNLRLRFYNFLKVREQAVFALRGQSEPQYDNSPQLKPDGPHVHRHKGL